MVTLLSDISLVQVTPQCAVGVPARPEAHPSGRGHIAALRSTR